MKEIKTGIGGGKARVKQFKKGEEKRTGAYNSASTHRREKKNTKRGGEKDIKIDCWGSKNSKKAARPYLGKTGNRGGCPGSHHKKYVGTTDIPSSTTS